MDNEIKMAKSEIRPQIPLLILVLILVLNRYLVGGFPGTYSMPNINTNNGFKSR